MQSGKDDTPKLAPRGAFRPAGVNIKDAIVSKERSGVVDNKAAAKQAPNAIAPPFSEKPIPTSSIAERIRERLKKGG